MLNHEKRRLRERLREKITGLPAADKQEKSLAICDKAASLPEVTGASHPLLYYPLSDEVDLRPLMKRLMDAGRNVLLPVTKPGQGIRVVKMQRDELDSMSKSHLGVPAPSNPEPANLSAVDLVIVPGRAFDRRCNRLGRGGGYYDRFLASLNPGVPRIALAFSCQVVEKVPAGPHDVPVDTVITENELIRAR